MSREGDPGISKDYFTPNEVAQLFLVSPVTVRQWAQKGLLRAALTAAVTGAFYAKIWSASRKHADLPELVAWQSPDLIVDDDSL